MALNMFLTAAVSDYGACVEGFIDANQVNTVQNVAVDLRKISSNCLTLSTLIQMIELQITFIHFFSKQQKKKTNRSIDVIDNHSISYFDYKLRGHAHVCSSSETGQID